MNTFDSTKEFLSTLLDEIRSGRIQLPDFQRSWVWDDDHIRSLLASVGRSFPIGAVMLLETGGQTHFQPRLVQGVSFSVADQPEPERLILDGQQRLTSLYQALRYGKVIDTQNARKQTIKRWYYIDIAKAVDTPEELDEAIIGLPENRRVLNFRGEVEKDYSSPEREYAEGLFPMSRVLDPGEWRHGYEEHWNYDRDKLKLFSAFEQQVLDAFKRYQVPLIVLRRDTAKEAVCQVFEKVNTGGVSLTAFELLTATYAAENYNLRDDWFGSQKRGIAGRRRRLQQHGVLKTLQETDFLQCVALLKTYHSRQTELARGIRPENAGAVSCKRITILNLPLSDYQQWAETATVGFERTARFLFQQKLFAEKDLPYRTQLVPLAAILASLGDRWEEEPVRRHVVRWYWCGVFGELYGGSIETRFARDLPEVIAWIDGTPEPITVTDANFSPNRLLTLRTRNSAAYKGLHALLMRNGGLDLRTGVPIDEAVYWHEDIDIHHIFPRAWCDKQGISPTRYNAIINKTALSARTNRLIGSDAPHVYLAKLSQQFGISEARLTELLASHLIDADSLMTDNFDAFFSRRQERLLERIEEAMGKPVLAPTAFVEGDLEVTDIEEADTA